MKAITYRNYGPPNVLKLEEVPKPHPKKNEICIRIYATSVNSADWRLRKPDPKLVRLFFGLFHPRNPILGGILAGVVESVGKDVTRFKVGDRVYGSVGMTLGTYAEYKCIKESAPISFIPENLNFKEAAALPFGGFTATHILTFLKEIRGRNVLLYGASSAIGTSLLQLLNFYEANVTTVSSKENFDLLKSLGARTVLDYKNPEFDSHSSKYDIVVECVDKLSFERCKSFVIPNGILVLASAGISDTLKGLWTSCFGGIKVHAGWVGTEPLTHLELLSKLSNEGKLKPIIDRIYKLEEMVQAHEYVEAGHKKGNVIVEIN